MNVSWDKFKKFASINIKNLHYIDSSEEYIVWTDIAGQNLRCVIQKETNDCQDFEDNFKNFNYLGEGFNIVSDIDLVKNTDTLIYSKNVTHLGNLYYFALSVQNSGKWSFKIKLNDIDYINLHVDDVKNVFQFKWAESPAPIRYDSGNNYYVIQFDPPEPIRFFNKVEVYINCEQNNKIMKKAIFYVHEGLK